MIDDASRSALDAFARSPSPDRVRPFDLPQGRVWVKTAIAPKTGAFYKFMKLFAALVGVQALRPGLVCGGQAGLDHEAARIRHLAAAGLPVADLVAAGQGWIAVLDRGRPVDSWLKLQEPLTAQAVVEQAARCGALLAQLHRAGQCHGRAKLNDIVIDAQGGLSFIDFEDDFSGIDISAVQAREIFLMTASLSRFTALAPDCQAAMMQAYAAGYDGAAVWRELDRLLAAVSFLKAPLRLAARWLGGDVRRARQAFLFLLEYRA